MPLTDITIRNAVPGPKPVKMTDGGGLFLLVNQAGKYWRMAYRFGGKQKLLALGVYPAISLAEARRRRDEAKRLLTDGIDPGEQRKAAKKVACGSETFEALAWEWMGRFRPHWSDGHAESVRTRLVNDAFPWIGSKPVDDLSAQDVLSVVRRVEDRGAHETARRVKQIIGQVCRFAVSTGRAVRNPAADVDLRLVLPPSRQQHYATIHDPREIGALLRAIDAYKGSFLTRAALMLAPLVFVRPGNLRAAEWSELDLDAAEWRIPAAKMKARDPHIVPLPHQAVRIFRDVHPLTGSGCYVFPGERSSDQCMSSNTLLGALRRIGYAGEMTVHGFRHMASTALHEQGWSSDVIERQLAHAERNKIKAAYNHAQHLQKRRKLLQAWADYLDTLRSGDSNVVALRGKLSPPG